MLIKLELQVISVSDNVEIKNKIKKLTDFILFLMQNTSFVQRRISVYENKKRHWFDFDMLKITLLLFLLSH